MIRPDTPRGFRIRVGKQKTRQVPVLVPQSTYEGGNTTVIIARIYCILRGVYDVIWSTLEFPSFNFNGIFDGFCILKGMSYMMPLSRHTLSLQTGLHRRFILGTIILPTLCIGLYPGMQWQH